MINSVSTFLKTTVSKYLQAFLSNSYILNEEVLSEFPESTRKGFINTFCTDGSHMGENIAVGFTYVPRKNNPRATILIQEEGGKEDDDTIGMNYGTTKKKSDHLLREYSYDHYDPKKNLAYEQVKHPIYKIIGMKNYDGKYKIIGNRIYKLGEFSAMIAQSNDNPAEKDTITYMPLNYKHKNSNRDYLLEGFGADESYTIDIISGNVDCIRCLVALIKAIFITMRTEAPAENTKLYLPQISEQGVDQVGVLNNPKNSTSGNQFYYHRFTLNYKLTYSLPQKVGLYIKHLVANPKYSNANITEKGSQNNN